jgi:hypothetical protein
MAMDIIGISSVQWQIWFRALDAAGAATYTAAGGETRTTRDAGGQIGRLNDFDQAE